jgi:hypothetical protein
MGNNSTKSVPAKADIEQKDPLDNIVRLSSSSRPPDPRHVYRDRMPSAAQVDSGSLESANNSASSKSLAYQQGFSNSTPSSVSVSLTAGRRGSSRPSELCLMCLEALANIPENGATQHHKELLSLEESVREGCHLCSLIHHFPPERSRRQSNAELTLSLRWDGSSSGSLLAGWKHEMLSFNLLQTADLTTSRE